VVAPVLHDNDCYYAKGGLIRFFDAKISVSSGARKSYFIVEPELAKQAWSPKDNNGTLTGGDTYLGTFYAYGTIGGAIPNLIFRNCRLGGPSINLFDKRTSGVAFVDMLNCTSLYFSSINLVATTTTGTLPGGGNGGENWSGNVDHRWGCQWNPSQGWDLSKPNAIKDARKFNGSFIFKNNILEFTRIDINRVDLTNANGQSTMNTLGNQVVNTLQRFDSVATAISVNYQLQRGSQFISWGTALPTTSLTSGKSYMIAAAGLSNVWTANWYNRGFDQTKLGIPAPGKMFSSTATFTLSGTSSVYPIIIDFIP
jgi:hypothetical protein